MPAFAEEILPPSDFDLQVAGIDINTSFPAIMNLLGKTKRFRLRKENADQYICYSSSKPNDDTLLLFSTGAMGSWNNMIFYDLLANKYDYPLHNNCLKSEKISKTLNFGPNFHLGIKKSKIIDRLGSPHKIGNNYIIYKFNALRTKDNPQLLPFNKTLWLNEGYFWVVTTMKFYFNENDELIYAIIGKTAST